MINPKLIPLAVPLHELRLDPKNARKHGDASVEAIAASLAQFGQQRPVVALSNGVVIAGNGTLAAARKLEWKELAVIRFDDEKKARAFALADNRTAELSEWDHAAVVDEWDHMEDDARAASGFTTDDIDDFEEHVHSPFVTTRVAIDKLKPHPRNYQGHPDDQLAHVMKSISEHGFYRNVVVARDNTILAGHGVVLAATKLGKKRVPVIRLDIGPDEPRALKVLTSDNEISNLAETDDRALTGLLKEIMDADTLDGTGFSGEQLANLAMVTRPANELQDFNAAAEWAGLPEHETREQPYKVVVNCETEQACEEAMKLLQAVMLKSEGRSKTYTVWWPPKGKDEQGAVRFTDEAPDQPESGSSPDPAADGIA